MHRNALAMMELQILVPALAAAFDFSRTEPTGAQPETSMTLRPKGPVLMHVRASS